jgi:membrane protein
MLAYFDVPFGWGELLRRTYREIVNKDAMGRAAELAYYFFLSLFPALLCVLAVASLFPLQDFTQQVMQMLRPFAPAAVVEIIGNQMISLGERNDTGLLSVGILGALWSSSAAMVAVVSSMNKAYEIEEGRPWWKVRLTAILLTLGLAFFVVLSFVLILLGPEVAEPFARRVGLGPVFVWTWTLIRWPIAFVLVAVAIELIYYFAPDADQDWVWLTPGSVVATLLWLVGSLGFRYYAINFTDYEASYGLVGAVILLMLWFYLTGLVVVIGAEVNAEIEHASPWGKAPGERRPGEKKKIGLAAARAHQARGQGPPPPRAREPFLEGALRPTVVERLLTYATLLVRWRNRSKSR